MIKIKNYILIIVFFCFCLNSFSQLKKKYYYDENKSEISFKEYKKKRDSRKFVSNIIEIDTAFIVIIFQSKTIDILDYEKHQKLNNYLFNLYDKEIDSTKTIVIYFLPYEESKKYKKEKSSQRIYKDEFLEEMNKDSSIEMLWIYHPEIENMTYHHNDKILWKADQGRLIQSMFFPIFNRYGIVIIKPNGRFLLNIGLDDPFKEYNSLLKELRF